MNAVKSKTKSEQIKEAKQFFKRLEASVVDAIKEGRTVSFTKTAGTADVGGGRFKKIAPNGTYLYEINVGPFWSHHP